MHNHWSTEVAMNSISTEVEVFKRTSDDWCPSYRLDDGKTALVEVGFAQLSEKVGWRVSVWGDDDCGMERDFLTEAEAWNCFLQVIGLDDVTRAELMHRGFSSA